MSNSDVGGPDPKYTAMANFVSILHADGTLALYAHLLKDSIVVKNGQYVKAGQPIGKSGATGFLGGPHLHFSVGRPTVDEKNQKLGNAYQTIAVKFSINGETTEVRTLDYLTLSSTRGNVEHNRSSCNSSPY